MNIGLQRLTACRFLYNGVNGLCLPASHMGQILFLTDDIDNENHNMHGKRVFLERL